MVLVGRRGSRGGGRGQGAGRGREGGGGGIYLSDGVWGRYHGP